ncbi:MAG: hypothetical protein Q9227_001786 [Pyrenula ochraceoflavens]
MGVPALFRWLSKKYPKIVSAVIEEKPYEIDGVEYPVDAKKPNPNGDEFDNLYLDFNGIVHNCTHPENKPAPESEAEMMMEIFKYTDRVVKAVRPRRVLMIAIDGVAPRAKMNQQRARRFRSAKDAQEADEKKAEFDQLLKRQQSKENGNTVASSEEEVVKKTWDTNLITPGTPFMDILALSIRYWVAYKLNTDPAWAELKVVISDATVPGEGEHKIMNFVRSQRTDPEYDPNTRHVFYGLDADLIMLGLATHEPYFRILREDVFAQESKAQQCKLCGQKGHVAEACRGNAKAKSGQFDEKGQLPDEKPFIWLSVSILREYLEAELFVPGQQFRFDLERALDDWLFMCFFVGNDFLPHLPSLNIHEGGIDTLIAIWRDNIPLMGGYLTIDGSVDLGKAQLILQGLAKQEAAIFKRRKEADDKQQRNQERRKREEEARNDSAKRRRRSSPDYGVGANNTRQKGKIDEREPTAPKLIAADSLPVTYSMIVNRSNVDRTNVMNKSAAAVLKEKMAGKGETTESDVSQSNGSKPPETPPSALGKRKADLIAEDDEGTPGRATPVTPETPAKTSQRLEDQQDTVKLWEEGYEDRYYEQKFHKDPKDIEFRRQVARSYVEGFCWVLLYYFQGCPSWTWYYPYHYAPFASDFVDIEKMEVHFEHGHPFKPYEQLMGVMPAASRAALPEAFHPLMTSEESEIIDFYPEDFDLDANGAKQPWKAVVLLPFIDESRLLAAMYKIYPTLSDEEHTRNTLGRNALLISNRNALYQPLTSNFYSKRSGDPKLDLPMRTGKLAGTVEKNDAHLPHSALFPPLDDMDLPIPVDIDTSIMVHYDMPHSRNVHKSMLLRGCKLPPKTLDEGDRRITQSKARTSGRSYGGVPLKNNESNGYHHSNGGGYNGRGRGGGGGYNGNISYAAHDRAPPPPPPPPHHQMMGGKVGGGSGSGSGSGGMNRDNPFAALIDPNFRPPPFMAGGGGGGGGGGGPQRGGPQGRPQYGAPPRGSGGGGGGGGGYGQGRNGYDAYDDRRGDRRSSYGNEGGYGGGGGGGYSRDGYYADHQQGSRGGGGSGGGGYAAQGRAGRDGGGGGYRGSYDPRFGDGYGRR